MFSTDLNYIKFVVVVCRQLSLIIQKQQQQRGVVAKTTANRPKKSAIFVMWPAAGGGVGFLAVFMANMANVRNVSGVPCFACFSVSRLASRFAFTAVCHKSHDSCMKLSCAWLYCCHCWCEGGCLCVCV